MPQASTIILTDDSSQLEQTAVASGVDTRGGWKVKQLQEEYPNERIIFTFHLI